MANEPNAKKWYENPLANMIIGFLLTGVLGTALTQHFLDRREREKLMAQAALDRKEIVRSMSELLSALQFRAELLAEALDANQDEAQIEARKTSFEASVEAWRTQSQSLALLTRDLMSAENYERFETAVEARLYDQALAPMRRCLLARYADELDLEGRARSADCDLDGLIALSSSCSQAVVEALYVFASASVSPQGAVDPAKLEPTIAQLEQDCP